MSLVDIKGLPNRLVDYVLIVGSRDTPRHHNGVLCPKLLRRIPQEDIRGSPLPPDVIYFCQPDGCYSARMTLEEMMEQQKLFLFCLTEKDSNVKRYGTCLNFFRPYRTPAASATTTIPEQDEPREADECADENEERAAAFEAKTSDDAPASMQETDGLSLQCTGVLTSVCLLSHHGFFSSFKEILMTFRDIVERLQMDGDMAVGMLK